MRGFAKACIVTPEHFNRGDVVALMNGFIDEGSMTLVYSPPKQGKSWLAYGAAKYLASCKEIEEVYYLDMDNSFSTMKSRGFDKILFKIDGFSCMTKSTIQGTPLDKLKEIATYAKAGSFNKTVFVIDTIKDFIDFNNPTQAKVFMNLLVEMRDAGATILLLHHSTKNEKSISGDQAFTNTPDSVYSLNQTNHEGEKLFFSLQVTHARGMMEDKNFSVDTLTLEIQEEEDPNVMLDEEQRSFVSLTKEILRKEPNGLNKSSLLGKLGYRKDDKRHGAMLEAWVDTFWCVHKERNIKIFILK